MRKINKLPNYIINQIKAGEVIERPASMIKELIENAIDAGATHLKLHIKENGISLFRIEDDGEGISFDEQPLAFERHATSKLERFEDLYNLSSFGFRGEALASIASIAKITLTSYPKNQQAAGKITLEAGEIQDHIPLAHTGEWGTTIHISDLFFNTPVRLKFIKSEAAEKNAIVKVVRSYLLAHPEISFSVQWDENEKELYKACEVDDQLQRFQLITKEDQLIVTNAAYDDFEIKIIASAAPSQSTKKHQFLIANNRPFFEPALHQAVVLGMQRLWQGISGHYLLIIKAPKDKLDVNLHPQKTHINFATGNYLFSMVKNSLSEKLKKEYPLEKQSISSEKEGHALNLLTPLLDNRYTILQSTQGLGVLDRKNYLAHVVKKILSKTLESHPIFIAYQINCTISKPETITKLQEYGFSFEKLDHNLFLLNAIPYPTPLIDISKLFLVLSEQLENETKDLLLRITEQFLNVYDEDFFTKINDIFSLDEKEQENYWQALNDQTLEKCFR